MTNLNKNWRRRNEILGINRNEKGSCGLMPFEHATLDMIKTLYDENYIDANDDDDGWNECAGNNAFYKFMQKYPGVECHGYVISIDRDDYRVTIEGLNYSSKNIPDDLRKEFTKNYRMADEFQNTKTKLYCWFD